MAKFWQTIFMLALGLPYVLSSCQSNPSILSRNDGRVNYLPRMIHLNWPIPSFLPDSSQQHSPARLKLVKTPPSVLLGPPLSPPPPPARGPDSPATPDRAPPATWPAAARSSPPSSPPISPSPWRCPPPYRCQVLASRTWSRRFNPIMTSADHGLPSADRRGDAL
jgi:hypothetical protein